MPIIMLLFSNIGYILAGLLAVTVLGFSRAKTSNLFASGVMLSLIDLAAWTTLWDDPNDMGFAHCILLMMALLFIRGQLGQKFTSTLIAMVVADTVLSLYATVLNGGELSAAPLFWWRSVLNTVFIYQCAIVIKNSTDKAIEQGRMAGREENQFTARVMENNHNGV